MAIIDLPPATAHAGAFARAQFQLGVDVSEAVFTGWMTGNRRRTSNLADRLRGTLTLPPTPDRVAAAAREALLLGLRSNGDLLRMTMPHRPTPLGTLRGSPTVAANVAAGARSVTLANGRAGSNLLQSADSMLTVLSPGWTTTNASKTADAVADPVGGSTGWVLTRTATGNHFAVATMTMASTALRTVSAYVWLRAGTLTGNVTLRIRDGAGGADVATVSVTPTSTWLPYRITATFGAGTAPNVQFYLDPANDAGSAGDTLEVWFAEVRALTGADTLCSALADGDTAPSGYLGAAELVTRTGAGNAFSLWTYTTTAHAGRTFTFSAWLKAGTFTGAVAARMRDGANLVDVATTSITLSGAWQQIVLTGTFGASPAANIVVYLDAADGGSVGETYSRYGVQLEVGGAATSFTPWPTLAAGDFLASSGNLLAVAYPGATGDVTGAITVPLSLPAPKALTAGAVVECLLPTGLWELDDDGLQLDYSAGNVQGGIAIPLRQVVL